VLGAAALLLAAGNAGGAVSGGPAPTSGPTVIGVAAAGKLLTGLSGNWAGFGAIGYRFQWYRCNAAGGHCLSIHGATSPTYALSGKDVGKTVSLAVRASDSTGTSTGYASLVGPVAPARPLLESTVQPAVSGPPVVGKTLEVTTGTWSPVPEKITYAWERCNANGRICAAIANATTNSYTPVQADLGHALLALVQATNGGTIQNAFSTASPAVVDGSVKGPTAVAGPSVAGAAIQGQPLTAAPGIWKGIGTISFSFQWYRCDTDGAHCTSIRRSAQPAYTPTPKDVGRTIAVTLRATDATGTTVAYASVVGPVAAGGATLTATTPPTIAGTARATGTLSVVYGLWSVPTARYSTAWLRCNRNGRLCAPIAGATRSTYLVTAADTGHTLVADVTATAGTITQSALSAATAAISAA
jgi:Ig domain of plant-specific actin-binding protein